MPLKNLDLQILKEAYNLLPDYIQIEQKTTYSNNWKGYQTSYALFANQRIKMTNYSSYFQFKETIQCLLSDAQKYIEQVKSSFENLITQLQPSYSEEETFNKLNGLLKFIPSEDRYKSEKATFQPTLGQVTVVEFWSDCQYESSQIDFKRTLANTQNMLEHNEEKWKDKVEIIEIFVKDRKYQVMDALKKLNKVQHYMVDKGEDEISDDIMKKLNDKIEKYYNLPFVLLLDKLGRIRYSGQLLSKTKLKTMINKYIEATDEADEKKDEKQKENYNEGKKKSEPKLLQKDQFKKLKALMKDEIVNIARNMDQENITFDVELIKINKINRDGSKVIIEKSQINLSYKVEVNKKQLIETFITDVWNKIPEDQRIIKNARINDLELNKIYIMEKFADAAKQIGFNLSLDSQKIKTFTFDHKLCEFSLKEQLNCTPKCQYTLDQLFKWEYKIKEFARSIETNPFEEYPEKDIIKDLTNNIQKSLQLSENDEFQTIDNYEKTEQITHKPGQVLVIEYWSKKKDESVNEILKNTLLLQKNAQKWGDKLRFVCLSKYEESKCKEFMEVIKQCQEYVEFYFPENDNDMVDHHKYRIENSPHYVVVDKWGKIRAIGQVKNLEELINQLLNQEGQEIVQEKVYLNKEQMNQIQALLNSNKVKELLGEFKYQNNFILQLQFEEQWGIKEGSDKFVLFRYNQPQLNYFVRKPQIEKLDAFLDQVYAIISKDVFKIDGQISNTIDIPFPGKECVICKKELNDQVQQYYSPFKNEFLCCECAEFDDKTKKGLARFKYTDTLIFINAPLTDLSVLKDIDDHKIGKNTKVGDDKEDRQKSISYGCNGCWSVTQKKPRYISVSAKPGKLQNQGGQKGYIDYCADCFAILKDKECEKAKIIVERSAADGMLSDSCLVRNLFDQEYYSYQYNQNHLQIFVSFWIPSILLIHFFIILHINYSLINIFRLVNMYKFITELILDQIRVEGMIYKLEDMTRLIESEKYSNFQIFQRILQMKYHPGRKMLISILFEDAEEEGVDEQEWRKWIQKNLMKEQ